MTIRVEPDPAHQAGHAVIRVEGAAGAVGRPGFRLLRDAGWEDDKLGPAGWQSSDALLVPDAAEADGADLVLRVGWGVCRHLEAGVYEIAVPGAAIEPTGVFWPDISPMHAGAVEVMPPAVTPATPNGPEPILPPQSATPKPEPSLPPVAPHLPPGSPPPLPPVQRSSKGLLIGLLIVALLLLAGGTAYLRLHRDQPTQEAAVTPPPPPTPPPTPPTTPATPAPTPPPSPPAPPTPPAPPPLALDRLSVPEVLARAPNPAAITAEGERRLRTDRRDDGMLLIEEAADRGDPAAAALMARLYDPVLFQPGGPIPKPDPRQAARYYRDAARGGVDVTAARDGLRQQLQTQSQNGDLAAGLNLKDFWP